MHSSGEENAFLLGVVVDFFGTLRLGLGIGIALGLGLAVTQNSPSCRTFLQFLQFLVPGGIGVHVVGDCEHRAGVACEGVAQSVHPKIACGEGLGLRIKVLAEICVGVGVTVTEEHGV